MVHTWKNAFPDEHSKQMQITSIHLSRKNMSKFNDTLFCQNIFTFKTCSNPSINIFLKKQKKQQQQPPIAPNENCFETWYH